MELLNESGKHEFFIPDTIGNRMNLLYDVMQIVYADGKVTRNEMAFVTNIINALNLEPEIVEDLMNLFDSHTPSPGEWDDFIETAIHAESKRVQTIL